MSKSQPEEGKTEFQWHIPENIIVLILSKVPVDSLLRFRCVSKSWRSLISDLSVQTHMVVLFNTVYGPKIKDREFTIKSIDDEGSIKYLQLPEPFSLMDPRELWGSCSELVLVSPSLSPYLFLWNPSTGFCKKALHKPSEKYIPIVSGLCHDPSTGDYKVVFASHIKWDTTYFSCIMVGSVRSKSWREINDHHVLHNNLRNKKVKDMVSGPSLNGVLHWVAYMEKVIDIVCFHMHSNDFTKLPMPSQKAFRRNQMFGLGVLGGCLAVVLRTGGRSSAGRFEVLSMKEYGNGGSWARLFVISSPLGIVDTLMPLLCTKKGEVMLLQNLRRILAYNPEDGSCRDISVNPAQIVKMAVFTDSLVVPPSHK